MDKKAHLVLSLESDRIYIRALGNRAVNVQIDVTPLLHFFKEAMECACTPDDDCNHCGVRIPEPTDPDYEDFQASR